MFFTWHWCSIWCNIYEGKICSFILPRSVSSGICQNIVKSTMSTECTLIHHIYSIWEIFWYSDSKSPFHRKWIRIFSHSRIQCLFIVFRSKHVMMSVISLEEGVHRIPLNIGLLIVALLFLGPWNKLLFTFASFKHQHYINSCFHILFTSQFPSTLPNNIWCFDI